MHEWVRDQKLNHFAVLTKTDKLSNQQTLKMRTTIQHDIKGVYSIFFSAKTLGGREDFLDAIQKVISGLEFKSPDQKQRRPQRNDDRQQKSQQGRSDRPRNDRGPRPPRPERQNRPDTADRPDRPEKPETERPEKGPRPERTRRPDRTDGNVRSPAQPTPVTPGQETQAPAPSQSPRGDSAENEQENAQTGRPKEGGAGNNRRRRWKSRKPGAEPRPNNPKND
jgi:hypothetical protein